MQWTEEHDTMLVREIMLFEPWLQRFGSVERGEVWKRISESLNQISIVRFSVDDRAVRDRFKRLEKRIKQKTANENNATGIAPPEDTEIENGIREITEQFHDFDTKRAAEKAEKDNKATQETAAAEEMRKKAMETHKKRKNSIEEDNSDSCSTPPSSKKAAKRKSGTETISYLREKNESELEFRKQELDIRRAEAEERQNNNKQLFDFLQQQQQQTNALLQGQQQVNLALLQVMQKFS